MSNADLRWRFTETPPNLSILVASDDGVSEGKIARFQIHLGFRRCAKHACPLVIEFSFPSGDHDRSQTIPDEVYARAPHIHQFVDAKDYCHTNRTETRWEEAIQRREQDDRRDLPLSIFHRAGVSQSRTSSDSAARFPDFHFSKNHFDF